MLYALWDRYSEDPGVESAGRGGHRRRLKCKRARARARVLVRLRL